MRFLTILWCLSGCHWLAQPSAPPSSRQSVARSTIPAPSVTCPYTITHRYISMTVGPYYWFGVDAVTDAEAVGAAMCCTPAVLQSVRDNDSVVAAVVGPEADGKHCTIDFATTIDSRTTLGPVLKRCHVPIPWAAPPAWLYAREVCVDFADLPSDCEDIASSATISAALSFGLSSDTDAGQGEMTGIPP